MTFNPTEAEHWAEWLQTHFVMGSPDAHAIAEQLRAACAEVDRLREKVSDMRSENVRAVQNHVDSQEAGARERIARKAAEADRDRLAAENEAKEHLIGVLRGDIGVLAAANEALRKERDDAQWAGAQERLARIEAEQERDSLRAENARLMAIIGKDAETIEGLRAQVNKMAEVVAASSVIRNRHADVFTNLMKGSDTDNWVRAIDTFHGRDAALQPDGGERE